MAMPSHQNPCPWGYEIYNFGRLFLIGHQYYIHSLSDLCLSREEDILKKIMHFHYITFMATTILQEPLPLGS